MATLGSACTSCLKEAAEEMAISASCSALGFSTSPLSAYKNVPLCPYSQSGTHIMKNEETSFTPGAVFRI